MYPAAGSLPAHRELPAGGAVGSAFQTHAPGSIGLESELDESALAPLPAVLLEFTGVTTFVAPGLPAA
jgi:hypothetical protein